MTKRMKVLRVQRSSIRLWLTGIGLLLMKDPEPLRFACGTFLVLAGASLRFWAKGYLTQGLELTTAGPYACCRHPFYFGNLLLDLGICLMVGRVDVLVVYSIPWFVIHHRQMKKEEQGLRLLHGAELYDRYASEVPRLLPLRFLSGLRRRGSGRFSWANANLARRFEVPRFLQAISYPLLFLGWAGLRKKGWHALEGSYTLEACLLSAFAYLQLLAKLLHLPVRKRRSLLPRKLTSTGGRMVFLLGFFTMVFAIRFPEIEDDLIHPIGLALSGVLVLFSFTYYVVLLRSHRLTLLHELLVCLVVSVIGETPWTFFVPLLFYTLIFAERLLVEGGAGGLSEPSHPPAEGPALSRVPRFQGLWTWMRLSGLLILGMLIMLLKEWTSDHSGPL